MPEAAEPNKSPQAKLKPSARLGSVKVRSLAAFENDGIERSDEGAAIPDIPRRRESPAAETGDYAAAHTSFRDLWSARVKANAAFRALQGGESKRLRNYINTSSSPELVPRSPDMPPPEPEPTRDAETVSPSPIPNSVWSRSTRSLAESTNSSLAPTHGSALPPLQSKAALETATLEPLLEEDFDPASFDLLAPTYESRPQYSLETRSELVFSADHLKVIFDDPVLLQRFAQFLHASKPKSVPLLLYYLDALKAIKAIGFANAIVRAMNSIDGLDFSHDSVAKTVNTSLINKANKAFETLAREDLPAYVTDTWIQIVSLTIKRRITDTLPLQLRELSEGLAETFCLTDPSRPDDPIVFASEEFHKTTQYGMGYVLGRNCRFLQGPKTNPHSVRRLREMMAADKECCETFLNYRRDGSPFMNLLMVAPLFDSRGVVRYRIGAQVDVSGLAKECAGLESLKRLVAQKEYKKADRQKEGNKLEDGPSGLGGHGERVQETGEDGQQKDEFLQLAEMFNLEELKVVRESGGIMHRTHQKEVGETDSVANWHRPRLLIKDESTLERRDSDPILQTFSNAMSSQGAGGGRLRGIYEHYLLVRPYPNMRILFASPSLRVPGMLQSNFMSRIGGSSNIRDAIMQAFADGYGVTAKVRWHTTSRAGSSSDRSQSRTDSLSNGGGDRGEGKGRWIHCTPLLGINGAVGVWMVVLVDDEAEATLRRVRNAPPVDSHIGRTRPFDTSSVFRARVRDRGGPGHSKHDGDEDDEGDDFERHSMRSDPYDDERMSLSSFAAATNRQAPMPNRGVRVSIGDRTQRE